jgi:hypothetical protein
VHRRSYSPLTIGVNRKTISIFPLIDDAYALHRDFGPRQIAASILLGRLAVDVSDLFATAEAQARCR